MAFNLQPSREPVWPADLDSRASVDVRAKRLRRPRKVDQILRSVANRHGISVASVLGGSQRQSFVTVRREAAQSLRDAGYLFSEIGGYLGRHRSGISKLIGNDRAPDYSGEWSI